MSTTSLPGCCRAWLLAPSAIAQQSFRPGCVNDKLEKAGMRSAASPRLAPTMALKKSIALRCPTCRTLVTAADADFPFGSDGCRLIDLGKWASGAYRISSPVHDPELLDELQGLQNASKSSRDDSDENA